MIKTLVILQARYNSSRLPGKVLKPILGQAMLAHQITRIEHATLVDKIIVATSNMNNDDEIAKLCTKLEVDCYRGELNDVLDRFYQASREINPINIIRLTGDCPLIDPDIIDKVIKLHLNDDFDYTSNSNPPTLPDGLDVEVFSFKALEKAWIHAKKQSDREHVTSFIRNNPDIFSCQNFEYDRDLSHLRWTVDEPEDFLFVNEVYRALYDDNPKFDLKDILLLIEENPSLTTINDKFKRNEGLHLSLSKDK